MIYCLVMTGVGLSVWGWFLRRGRRSLVRGAGPPAPWGGPELLILLVVLLVSMTGSGWLFGLPPERGRDRGQPTTTQATSAPAETTQPAAPTTLHVGPQALAMVVSAGVALVLARRYGRQGLAALGLEARALRPQAFLGAAGFLAVLPLMFGVTWLVYLLKGPPEQQEVVRRLQTEPLGLIYTFQALYVVLGAPLAEEVIFRGFLQGYLERLLPKGMAVLVAAGAFASFHEPLHAAVVVFFLGVILGYERTRTGSLLAPFITHILFNLHTLVTVLLSRA